jgi:hypothetical protein
MPSWYTNSTMLNFISLLHSHQAVNFPPLCLRFPTPYPLCNLPLSGQGRIACEPSECRIVCPLLREEIFVSLTSLMTLLFPSILFSSSSVLSISSLPLSFVLYTFISSLFLISCPLILPFPLLTCLLPAFYSPLICSFFASLFFAPLFYFPSIPILLANPLPSSFVLCPSRISVWLPSKLRYGKTTG